MTAQAERFAELIRSLIALRVSAEYTEAAEDALLDEMDVLWYAMSIAEQAEAEAAAQRLILDDAAAHNASLDGPRG